MISNDLNTTLNKNQHLKSWIVNTEGENSQWARVVCRWHEKTTEKHKLVHTFTPLINQKTGEIYLDCSKTKIYVKFLAHTLVRPFQVVFKTAYHLGFPISIPHIIYQTYQSMKDETNGKEIAKECLKRSIYSLMDIVRTPIYGLAMTIVNLAALIFSPFAPKTLYDFRAYTGQLIQSLYRVKEDDMADDIFKCFQPIDKLQTIKNWNKEKKDTSYTSNCSYLKGLSNFTRAQVNYKRNNYSPCDQLIGKLDPSIAYKSSTYNREKYKQLGFKH